MLRAELPAVAPATSLPGRGCRSLPGQSPAQGQKNLEAGHRAVSAAAPLLCTMSAWVLIPLILCMRVQIFTSIDV